VSRTFEEASHETLHGLLRSAQYNISTKFGDVSEQQVAHIYHCASRPKPIGTVEEQYTVQEFLLVRQYDQPSYDNEELAVDYAFEVLSVKKKRKPN
jgi:hypothetical protein